MRRLPFLFIMLALLGAYGCGNRQQQPTTDNTTDSSMIDTITDSLMVDSMPQPDKHQASYELNPADSLLVADFYKLFIQSRFGNDSVAIQRFIRQQAASLDSCYLIHFKQLINGYDIRMNINDIRCADYEQSYCDGDMIIANGKKVICDSTFFYCIPLPDSVCDRLVTHKINELDYAKPSDPYYYGFKYPTLVQFSDMPFAFFDIDFDGEKELLLRGLGYCQRGRDGYQVISLNWETPCHWVEDSMIPDELDDATQYDIKNKTLIFSISAGAWENKWLYYKKIKNGKWKHVKDIIEYFEPNQDSLIYKVKRITYHDKGSTETNIPVGEDLSYSID